jgi:carboxymethylenebutenolidase
VAIIPDYYRGAGPTEPDNYDDIAALMTCIGALDFARAANDLVDAVEYLRSCSYVDPTRMASWGYCTGATLALLAAELHPAISVSVIFYPSQPMHASITPKTPVHAWDLLWSLRGSTLLLIGDQDVVLTAELLLEYRRRLEQWRITHEIVVYAGAGHAFNARGSSFYNEAADRASLPRAVQYLEANLKLGAA